MTDNTLSETTLRAMRAVDSAFQLVPGIVHAPMQYVMGELWHKACEYVSDGATILQITKDDMLGGKLESSLDGHLFYAPENCREKLVDSNFVSLEDVETIKQCGCQLNRITTDKITVDTTMTTMAHASAERTDKLHDELMTAMLSIVQALRDAGTAVAATIPDASVNQGELPFQVDIHIYGWVGILHQT